MLIIIVLLYFTHVPALFSGLCSYFQSFILLSANRKGEPGDFIMCVISDRQRLNTREAVPNHYNSHLHWQCSKQWALLMNVLASSPWTTIARKNFEILHWASPHLIASVYLTKWHERSARSSPSMLYICILQGLEVAKVWDCSMHMQVLTQILNTCMSHM